MPAQPNIRDFYRDHLYRTTLNVDTSIVLQMQRIITLSIDDIFVPLTASEREQKRLRPWLKLVSADGRSKLELQTDETGRVYERPPTTASHVPVEEIVVRSPFAVLLGDPGSGKSTLTKWFVHRWAKANGASAASDLFSQTPSVKYSLASLLPVPVTLRYFAEQLQKDSQLALGDYLSRKEAWKPLWMDERGAEIGSWLLDRAHNGECLFLFDGLDEAINAELRGRVVDAIERFVNIRPACRFLVTSRIVGYELAPLSPTFTEYELEPFDAKQTHEFFHKWALAAERREDIRPDNAPPDEFTRRRARARANAILQGLGFDPDRPAERTSSGTEPGRERFQQLARNPMLCTLIGLIHHQGKRLPEDRVELYRLCLEAFIYDWEIQKRVSQTERQSLDKFETLDVLEELAFFLHEQTTDNGISRDQLSNLIETFLRREKGLSAELAVVPTRHEIELIHDRASLLIERGHEEYGFSHLQFQEYLTGRAITRRRSEIPRILREHLWQSRWQEPILLAAGHRAQHSEEAATEFIEAVRITPCPFQKSDLPDLEALLHHALFAAARCLRDARRVHFRLRERLSSEFRNLFSDRERIYLWTRAAQVLSGTYSEEAILPLLEVLRQDKDDVVRANAAHALGAMRAEQAVAPLLELLHQDKSDLVRSSAAQALGVIRSKEAVAPLLELLRSGKNDLVRLSAAEALGAMRAEQAAAPLLELLRQDENDLVRGSAAEALGAMRAEQAVAPLLEVLHHDESDIVRTFAAEALGAMRAKQAVESLLEVLRHDKSDGVRMMAARGLGAMGSEQAVGSLLEVLRHDKSDGVRMIAALALGAMNTEQAVRPLLEVLRQEESEDLRGYVANALGEIRSEQAVGPLLEVLRQEESDFVRSSAARALGAIRAKQAVELLLEVLLQNKSDSVRSSAAQALGAMRVEQAIGPLLEALSQDKSDTVRRSATQALGAIRSKKVLPELAAMLVDKNFSQIWAAIDGALREILCE